MAGRKIFSFGLEGIEAMVGALDQIDEHIERRIDEVLTKLALKVAHDAKRLAPIDSGDLEAAINVGEVKKLIGMTYIDIGTSPEVDQYAVVQHEGFRHTSNGSIVEMKPGEKTLSKGSYNGYLPGKKFLENALKMNENLIIEELSKVLGVA
ncbi:HK97 gp10 family phage protein [Cohnella lubricantis]|uniref:HK97 gp10 family phage protein n=1 Tax=Cohnella lubricantis TaxID=2163172 RepID=A0A841TAT6_9BACL|nr:HK97 gp10 family phage protein [Cohnella lubricantis]MBB6676508.1 HK97 gp10 family phage protein [Cohnella lubricantis]MBP2117128.1 HK97 gp10 family phage protein [Cohnella lubricantis]